MDKGGTFRVPGDPLASGTNRPAKVFLERLTDPSASATATTWTSASGTNVGTNVPHYHVVDQAPITVVNRTPGQSTAVPPPSVTKRDIAAAGLALWRSMEPADLVNPPPLDSLGPTAFSGPNRATWFPWPNRPFTSAAELFLVPWVDSGKIASGSNAVGMLDCYTAVSPSSNSLVTMHAGTNPLWLLDAVHVPTRFAGIHRTVTSGTSDLTKIGIHAVTSPVNQLSSYREPGRVNLNTVTADDVWNSVIAGPLAAPADTRKAAPLKGRADTSGTASQGNYPVAPTPPPVSANFMAQPAERLESLLALQGTGTAQGTNLPASFSADTHPALAASGSFNSAHLLYTANRLANTATVRSNVFAVWITVRESIENDPDSVRYHRAFYIVDRSIPVAHEPGKDHNVWDTVVLRRIIE